MTRRLVGAAADSAPVVILAGTAAAGSFTHIRDTATDHGQRGWMAWAIAVCIDLTCVMAAGERQRDKRTGRRTGHLSWPTLVLVGGILLSLAANLAQADRSVWGWITAGTPAGAFLVAVSMLERRKAAPADRSSSVPTPDALTVPDSFGRPPPATSVSSSSPWFVWEDDRPRADDAVPSAAPRTTDRRTTKRRQTARPRSASARNPRPIRLRPRLWSTSPAASRTNTTASTDARLPVTLCAPGSGCPTSSPLTCSARSAPSPHPLPDDWSHTMTTHTGGRSDVAPPDAFIGHANQRRRVLSPFRGWVCGTCGGGGVASDGSTCPDCGGHGHTH